MGAKALQGSILTGTLGIFISNVTASTGAAQNIAHGLGRIPGKFIVIPVIGSNGAGAAGVQMPAAAFTVTADVTNVIVTGPAAFNGGSFQVIAF